MPTPALDPAASASRTRWSTRRPAADPRVRIAYRPRCDLPGLDADGVLCLPSLVTLLLPDEQRRLDTVAGDVCRTLAHVTTVSELADALGRRPADAVVLSAEAVAAGGTVAIGGIARLARTFAGTPMIALVSNDVPPAVLVALGRSGARGVLDVRSGHGAVAGSGWQGLRALLPSMGVRTLAHHAEERLAGSLAEVSPGMRRFVVTLFDVPPRVRTVRTLAPRFGVLPTTMMSRFFRAGLPAPKQYLAVARMVRAAQLLQHRAWSVSAAAAELEYSSAQAFSRHLFLHLGVRPREFRRRFGVDAMLDRFAEELLAPYGAVLSTFIPF